MKMMDITDMLFQRTASDRQQVIAFTGISGKTHTAELIAHIAGYTCLPAEDERRLQDVGPAHAFRDGYAILDADDDRVYSLKKDMRCTVVLFSRSTFNQRVIDHCREGGMAVIIENGYYVICEGTAKTRVIPVTSVPLSFSATAQFVVRTVLPALGAAFISGFSLEAIRKALLSFTPIPDSIGDGQIA